MFRVAEKYPATLLLWQPERLTFHTDISLPGPLLLNALNRFHIADNPGSLRTSSKKAARIDCFLTAQGYLIRQLLTVCR